MTADEFHIAMCTKIPVQYQSCLSALVEIVKSDPECYKHTIQKITDKINLPRAHVAEFMKALRRMSKPRNEEQE